MPIDQQHYYQVARADQLPKSDAGAYQEFRTNPNSITLDKIKQFFGQTNLSESVFAGFSSDDLTKILRQATAQYSASETKDPVVNHAIQALLYQALKTINKEQERIIQDSNLVKPKGLAEKIRLMQQVVSSMPADVMDKFYAYTAPDGNRIDSLMDTVYQQCFKDTPPSIKDKNLLSALRKLSVEDLQSGRLELEDQYFRMQKRLMRLYNTDNIGTALDQLQKEAKLNTRAKEVLKNFGAIKSSFENKTPLIDDKQFERYLEDITNAKLEGKVKKSADKNYSLHKFKHNRLVATLGGDRRLLNPQELLTIFELRYSEKKAPYITNYVNKTGQQVRLSSNNIKTAISYFNKPDSNPKLLDMHKNVLVTLYEIIGSYEDVLLIGTGMFGDVKFGFDPITGSSTAIKKETSGINVHIDQKSFATVMNEVYKRNAKRDETGDKQRASEAEITELTGLQIASGKRIKNGPKWGVQFKGKNFKTGKDTGIYSKDESHTVHYSIQKLLHGVDGREEINELNSQNQQGEITAEQQLTASLSYAISMMDKLYQLHHKGIIHGDIKPKNFKDGEWFDFGTSHLVDIKGQSEEQINQLLSTHKTAATFDINKDGTPEYLSPDIKNKAKLEAKQSKRYGEVIKAGNPKVSITASDDIFALGASIFGITNKETYEQVTKLRGRRPGTDKNYSGIAGMIEIPHNDFESRGLRLDLLAEQVAATANNPTFKNIANELKQMAAKMCAPTKKERATDADLKSYIQQLKTLLVKAQSAQDNHYLLEANLEQRFKQMIATSDVGAESKAKSQQDIIQQLESKFRIENYELVAEPSKGKPLINILIENLPDDRSPDFTKLLSRLESGQILALCKEHTSGKESPLAVAVLSKKPKLFAALCNKLPIDALEKLLTQDFNLQAAGNQNLLYIAAELNQTEILQTIFTKFSGSKNKLKELIFTKTTQDKTSYNLLEWAILHNNITLLNLFVDQFSSSEFKQLILNNPDQHGHNLFHAVVFQKKNEAFKVLQQKIYGNDNYTELLQDTFSNVSKANLPPLLVTFDNNERLVKALIDKAKSDPAFKAVFDKFLLDTNNIYALSAYQMAIKGNNAIVINLVHTYAKDNNLVTSENLSNIQDKNGNNPLSDTIVNGNLTLATEYINTSTSLSHLLHDKNNSGSSALDQLFLDDDSAHFDLNDQLFATIQNKAKAANHSLHKELDKKLSNGYSPLYLTVQNGQRTAAVSIASMLSPKPEDAINFIKTHYKSKSGVENIFHQMFVDEKHATVFEGVLQGLFKNISNQTTRTNIAEEIQKLLNRASSNGTAWDMIDALPERRSKQIKGVLSSLYGIKDPAVTSTVSANSSQVNMSDAARGYTELHHAANDGDLAKVRRILQEYKGDLIAYINQKTKSGSGRTALTIAAKRGHLDVVKALIAAGANVMIGKVDNDDKKLIATSMHHAHIESFRYLMQLEVPVIHKYMNDKNLNPNQQQELISLLETRRKGKWSVEHNKAFKAFIDNHGELPQLASITLNLAGLTPFESLRLTNPNLNDDILQIPEITPAQPKASPPPSPAASGYGPATPQAGAGELLRSPSPSPARSEASSAFDTPSGSPVAIDSDSSSYVTLKPQPKEPTETRVDERRLYIQGNHLATGGNAQDGEDVIVQQTAKVTKRRPAAPAGFGYDNDVDEPRTPFPAPASSTQPLSGAFATPKVTPTPPNSPNVYGRLPPSPATSDYGSDSGVNDPRPTESDEPATPPTTKSKRTPPDLVIPKIDEPITPPSAPASVVSSAYGSGGIKIPQQTERRAEFTAFAEGDPKFTIVIDKTNIPYAIINASIPTNKHPANVLEAFLTCYLAQDRTKPTIRQLQCDDVSMKNMYYAFAQIFEQAGLPIQWDDQLKVIKDRAPRPHNDPSLNRAHIRDPNSIRPAGADRRVAYKQLGLLFGLDLFAEEYKLKEGFRNTNLFRKHIHEHINKLYLDPTCNVKEIQAHLERLGKEGSQNLHEIEQKGLYLYAHSTTLETKLGSKKEFEGLNVLKFIEQAFRKMINTISGASKAEQGQPKAPQAGTMRFTDKQPPAFDIPKRPEGEGIQDKPQTPKPGGKGC